MLERAFTVEPTRYEAAQAWLVHVCTAGTDDKAQQLVDSEKGVTTPLRETATFTISFPDSGTLVVKSLDGTEHSFTKG